MDKIKQDLRMLWKVFSISFGQTLGVYLNRIFLMLCYFCVKRASLYQKSTNRRIAISKLRECLYGKIISWELHTDHENRNTTNSRNRMQHLKY